MHSIRRLIVDCRLSSSLHDTHGVGLALLRLFNQSLARCSGYYSMHVRGLQSSLVVPKKIMIDLGLAKSRS